MNRYIQQSVRRVVTCGDGWVPPTSTALAELCDVIQGKELPDNSERCEPTAGQQLRLLVLHLRTTHDTCGGENGEADIDVPRKTTSSDNNSTEEHSPECGSSGRILSSLSLFRTKQAATPNWVRDAVTRGLRHEVGNLVVPCLHRFSCFHSSTE